ncbi:hypothetical protein BDW22DRAFT_427661 [Trametopsis cervina]|nr:hypothetical protein BDW22DRAFT_427661 [Trametopsis cervina]
MPPSSSNLSPGSRLRPKTSDFSDLLHSRNSRSSSTSLAEADTPPPVPPMPSSSAAVTPTKPKGKLAGFLARKRKSGGIALTESRPYDREEDSGQYPAIPEALVRSRIPSAPQPSTGSSLPSSLPPLNVSPTSLATSFASATADTPQKPRGHFGVSDSSAKHLSSALPFRGVKTQKSTSFEVSRPFNVTHMATASNMAMLNGSTSRIPSANIASTEPKSKSNTSGSPTGMKPLITVSAPPIGREVENDRDIYNAPRTAPAPPSISSVSTTPSKTSRGGKEPHGMAKKFGFGHHKSSKNDLSDKERSSKEKGKEPALPSPTPSLSPMLPPKMQFPVPPSSARSKTPSGSGPANGNKPSAPALTEAFQTLSPAPSSLATISPHTATASDVSDDDLSPASPGSSRAASAVQSRPVRPVSLIIPAGGPRQHTVSTSSAISTKTATSATSPPSSPSSPTPPHGRPSFPPSSRLNMHRASYRSVTPASPPPLSPLPSPPISTTSFPVSSSDAEAGYSTDASTRFGYGGWSTDASTRVGSLITKKSGLSLGSGTSGSTRMRVNTITNTNSATGGPRAVAAAAASAGMPASAIRMEGVRPRIGSPRRRTRLCWLLMSN